jgi:uncharacterized integral membrane protein
MSEQRPVAGQSNEQGTAVQPTAAQSGVAPADAGQPQAGAPQVAAGATPPPRQHVVRRTRMGGLWVALALSALVLLLLLIFILENGRKASVAFFGAHATMPLGVGLLLAAVFGALIVVIPGTGRIIQLRITARRHRRVDAKQTTPGTAPPPGSPGPGA